MPCPEPSAWDGQLPTLAKVQKGLRPAHQTERLSFLSCFRQLFAQVILKSPPFFSLWLNNKSSFFPLSFYCAKSRTCSPRQWAAGALPATSQNEDRRPHGILLKATDPRPAVPGTMCLKRSPKRQPPKQIVFSLKKKKEIQVLIFKRPHSHPTEPAAHKAHLSISLYVHAEGPFCPP